MAHRLLTRLLNMTRTKSKIIIYDSFTDTNGTPISTHVIAPTNTVGATWAQYYRLSTTNITIQSNKASFPSADASFNITDAVVDALTANVTVTAAFTPYSDGSRFQSPGITVRYTDTLNFFYFQLAPPSSIDLVENTGVSSFVRASAAVAIANTETTLSFSANGNALQCIAADYGVTLNYSTAVRNTVTVHGFRQEKFGPSGAPDGTAENFRIEEA